MRLARALESGVTRGEREDVMLDIKRVLGDLDEVSRGLARRGFELPVDELRKLDTTRRSTIAEMEALKAEQWQEALPKLEMWCEHFPDHSRSMGRHMCAGTSTRRS